MYYDHFGLTQAPFKITPNTDFFFTGGNRGAILDALMYAVSHGEGIVKVTGEVGSGKTMLCNMLQARLPPHVECVYLANPSVAPEEVLHAIAFELQLDVARDADRLSVIHALQEYLVQRHAEGKRVVVFIEESQSMPIATLEEIRLLSNLETRSDKLLQILLFGQPELDENLRQQNIRQLRDRIAHSFRLEPLSAEDVREYLNFRLRAAGYKGPEIFTMDIVKRIARASSGLTRRINLIADKVLLAAFSENTHTIKPKHVDAALRDSEFAEPRTARKALPAYTWPAAAMVVGVVLGASVYAFVAEAPTTRHTEAMTQPQSIKPEAKPTAASNQAAAPVPPEARTQALAPTVAASETDAAVPTATATVHLAQTAQQTLQTAAKTDAAKASGSAPPETTSHSSDWVSARLDATERWLAQQPVSAYSIQILGGANETQLKQHLSMLSKSVEAEKVFLYRGEARGRPWINVLYGVYPDRRTAQRALEALPAALQANRPMLRTVGGLRAEIRRLHGA